MAFGMVKLVSSTWTNLKLWISVPRSQHSIAQHLPPGVWVIHCQACRSVSGEARSILHAAEWEGRWKKWTGIVPQARLVLHGNWVVSLIIENTWYNWDSYVICWCARIFESKVYLVSHSCTNTDRRCSTCGFLGHKSTGRIPSAACWWSRSIFSLSYASPGPQITYILFKCCSSTVKTSSHGHWGLLV
jgi:hypothetical protein